MIAVTLRGLFSRKLRTILTMIAIVLGVSMISGTYVLTDTIDASFAQIFRQANRNIDAVISPKQVVSSAFSLPPPLPARLLTVVKATKGVAAAEGEIADFAQLFDLHGKQIGSVGGAPTLLFSVPAPRFRATTTVAGHDPHGNEIALDEGSVSRFHLHLGQTVEVAAGNNPIARYVLAGITRFGDVGSVGGATLVSMDLSTAQRITGKQGKYDQIVVAGAPGLSHAALARRLKARIPPGLRSRVQVKTSEQNVVDQTNAIANALNFLTIGLLAFGGIAVFVGAFIIFNTFSITVAQRTREFGLLRTLGASRQQILRSVVSEAFVIGVLASLAGLVAGFGVAQGLGALFKLFGADLPNAGFVVETRTIVVALFVGIIITLAAALWPAIRATRVPPIAALQRGVSLPAGKLARFGPGLAGVFTLLGTLLLLYGIFGAIAGAGPRLLVIGAGVLLLFVGIAMISPTLVRPLALVVGWPIERMTSITGRLARENAVRNPSRTAVTAAALMIGLALVGFVTIFAAELRKTANDAIDRELAGSFAVYGDRALLPEAVGAAVARVPGVQIVSSVKAANARYTGIGVERTSGIQPSTFGTVYRFQWKAGSNATLTHLGMHQALIADSFASDHHLVVGAALHVTTTAGRHDTFTVAGIYKSSQLLSSICIPYRTMRIDWQLHKDRLVLVQAKPGQNLALLQTRIDRVLTSIFPAAQAHSQQDIKNQQNQRVNQLLVLIYVLLAMSVLVSLFGIVNTLVLSIYERTREIGMLRSIGATRSQVRWIIRWESVITAVIGAVLGLSLGIALAALITAGLASQQLEFTLPIVQLLIWMAFAVLFGIVAAAFPARRAARLDVLQAVAYE